MRYVYTIPDGKLEEYKTENESGEEVMLPVLRERDVGPPCDSCPRGGPENEKRYRLTRRNQAAFDLYLRLDATHGQYLVPGYMRECVVFADNMRTVKDALEEAKALVQKRAYDDADKNAKVDQ